MFDGYPNIVSTRKIVKETWLQIRIDEETKADFKIVAKLRGLSSSALVHSLIVKLIREEKQVAPEAFKKPERHSVMTMRKVKKVGSLSEEKSKSRNKKPA